MVKEYVITDVAIYLRKSRGESERDLDKHRDALIDICKNHGWKFNIYEEIGSGETIEMRSKVQELLEDVKDDLYDAVLVIDQDRLSRGDTNDTEVIKETLVKSNTLLIDSGKVYDLSNDQDEFVYELKSVFSRQEYKQIKKRLRRGKVYGAKKGFWTNGNPPIPYRYNSEKKTLEIDESLLVTYRFIIDSVVKDKKPTNQIAYELNRRGKKTSANWLWTSKTVRDTLLDMTHLEFENTGNGHIVIGKTRGNAHLKRSSKAEKFKRIDQKDWRVFQGRHLALKFQTEHDIIEVFLKRKTKAPRRPTSSQKIYPFTGLLKCGICGHYIGFFERSDRKGFLSVKNCWYTDPYGVKCTNRSSPMLQVIHKVTEMIEKHIRDVEEEIDTTDFKRLEEITETIRGNQKLLRDKEGAMERMYVAYEARVYTLEVFNLRSKKLKEEMDTISEDIRLLQIEQKFLQEQGNKERVNIYKEFKEIIRNPNLTWEDQNELYKTIIDTVTYKRLGEEIHLEISYK